MALPFEPSDSSRIEPSQIRKKRAASICWRRVFFCLMIVAEGMRLFPYIIIGEGNGTYSLPIRRAISFTAKVMTSPA